MGRRPRSPQLPSGPTRHPPWPRWKSATDNGSRYATRPLSAVSRSTPFDGGSGRSRSPGNVTSAATTWSACHPTWHGGRRARRVLRRPPVSWSAFGIAPHCSPRSVRSGTNYCDRLMRSSGYSRPTLRQSSTCESYSWRADRRPHNSRDRIAGPNAMASVPQCRSGCAGRKMSPAIAASLEA